MIFSHHAQRIKNAQMGDFNFKMVIPKGVEPLIFWMRTRRPGPLDDGTTYRPSLTEKGTSVKRPKDALKYT